MMGIKEYLEMEFKIQGLDDELILDVPLWRLVRTQFRWKIRDSRPFTVKPIIRPGVLILNYIKSFFQMVKVCFGGKKVTAIFFPQPRLMYVDGLYLERMSDPLIDVSGIDSYMILERNQNGIHRQPRYHQSHVVYLDFVDVSARFLANVVRPFIKKIYKSQVDSLYEKLNEVFHMNDMSYKTLFLNVITEFMLSRWLIKPVLRKLNPQLVFFSPRGTFTYATSYCKQRGSKTIELQHGITLKDTDLYSSATYNPNFDPDYFFVFGSSNIGTQYGMPIDRVMNIGYPYKQYIKAIKQEPFGSNVALVASEPKITDQIIFVLIDILVYYPQYEFHFRCHPQETLSDRQLQKIAQYPQIQIVNNHIESFCALSQYEVVLGTLSSVLFEAMSLHKKIGRLNYGGLQSSDTELLHGGTKIESAEDFHRFMSTPYSDENDSKNIYSDYQPETLNQLLK